LERWQNHFSQLFDVLGVSDVRQTEIHTAEPLVHEPSTYEVELAIEKLKSKKSLSINLIPAELRHRVEQFAMISIIYYFYLE